MKNNMPYNVMRHRDWDNAPRATAVAAWATGYASFAAAAAAGSAFAYAAVYIGASFAISAVTSWAISALSPKPDFSSFGSQGTLVNARDATAAADFVYGQVRKGGTVTFYESTGDENKFLHQIIVLASHEVQEIGDIYINDQIVTLDSSGFVTTSEWVIDGGANASGVRIEKFDGSQTAAPYNLLQESELTGANALTANFIGNGIAYLYVRYEYDANVFANGVPLITAIVKGKKVYDPRTSSTAYSNNAALCMRDFITSEYGLNDSAIDDVVFSAAANESDEDVTLSAGGTEKRYTINGIVKASSPIGDVLGKMSTACAGTLFWGSGYWKLKVGAYTAPVKTLTLDDLRGPINLSTRTTMRDSFNGVTGTFNDAEADFITADYPSIKSTVFKAEDGGDELLLDLSLPFTTSAATAQRIAKMTLYRSREQMAISADFGLEAFNIEVGDIIAFTNARYGFDEKEFEVIGWKFASNQDAGDLRVNLTLQETSEAAFSWTSTETEIIGNNTNLPDPYAGLIVQNLTAIAGGRTQGDGTFINSAILSWDAADSAFVEYYDIEWKASSDTVYASTTTAQTTIEISPLIDNVQYNFRVRSVTASGVKGAFATVNLTGGGDTTAPGLPTSITAQGGFRYITINWTNPADADLKHVEIWENDTNTTSGASLAGISGGSEFIRSNLNVDQTKYYFLKSVDFSANKSAFTSGVSATTTFLDDPDFENGIYTLFKDQGLYAIEDVTSLPASGSFIGEKVFNRTDGKLYSWTGTAWEATVGDVEAGSITATEIADGAISTPKLAANAVTATKILAGTITGDKITANTITGGLIAASGIITNSAQINDAIITNAKIDNIAADKITAGTLDVARLPGIGVAGATTASSSFNTSGSVSITVAFSGVTVGSSMMAILTGRFGMSKQSPIISIVPTGSGVTLAHTQSTGGFVSENATAITPYSHGVSATATATSGTLGFSLGGSPSGSMFYTVAVSLLTFKA